MRIKNNEDFYEHLHEMEDQDSGWFEHVGNEVRLNVYADDGDPYTPVKLIQYERKQLRQIREFIEPEYHGWKNESKRDGMRLLVTLYRQYKLNYDEISKIIGIPASTIRHDYKELDYGEELHGDYRIKL